MVISFAFSCFLVSPNSVASYELDLDNFLPSLFDEIKVQCLLFVTLMVIIIFDIDKIIAEVYGLRSTQPQITWVVPFYFHLKLRPSRQS